MIDTITVRVRCHGDVRKWQDIPPIEKHVIARAGLGEGHEAALFVAQTNYLIDNVREVRWNYKGSLQGHYIGLSSRWETENGNRML